MCDEKNGERQLKPTKSGVDLEVYDYHENRTATATVENPSDDFDDDVSLTVSNATAKWTKNLVVYSLRDVNLTVKRNRLVAIIGPVGAGKVRVKNNDQSYRFYKRSTKIQNVYNKHVVLCIL